MYNFPQVENPKRRAGQGASDSGTGGVWRRDRGRLSSDKGCPDICPSKLIDFLGFLLFYVFSLLFLLFSVPFSTVQYRSVREVLNEVFFDVFLRSFNSVPFSTVQYRSVREVLNEVFLRCFWGASIQYRSVPFSTWGTERCVFEVFLRSFKFSTVQHRSAREVLNEVFLRCFGSFEVQIPPRRRMH